MKHWHRNNLPYTVIRRRAPWRRLTLLVVLMLAAGYGLGAWWAAARPVSGLWTGRSGRGRLDLQLREHGGVVTGTALVVGGPSARETAQIAYTVSGTTAGGQLVLVLRASDGSALTLAGVLPRRGEMDVALAPAGDSVRVIARPVLTRQ